ncbi:MAG: SUMF1/EgtB/PvdO family nonheme iron enzyme, partial [Xenococcaceae cyanobacterium MO_234.B1]|nr:SUMF1/EgtB/PvdO family nonheme iron enzyme [Xenococcaceae cyanobacterium MO_234.B1]
LLTHDTDPDSIAGTALPMEAIDSVLRDTLLAQRVIVMADTCHSGGISGNFGKRSAIDHSELMNRYFQSLSQSQEGVAILTSAEAREVAQEGEQWGGGHGVFTYYILEGMRGAAVRDRNGIVTVGNLFEYVREKVKEATNNKQHPSIGTNPFDRNLPISIPDQGYTEELAEDVFLEMGLIPEGSFQMGSNKNIEEQPVHEVTMQPFFMSKYPITQEQWKAVAALPKVKRKLNPEPSRFKGDSLPVERVSWYDAKEFCARLSNHSSYNYRLPSEAEWEYACRAGTTTPFNFGETLTNSTANCNDKLTDVYEIDEYNKETTSVVSFPPNAFGLCDMHGNVYEWCEDFWYPNYEQAPNNGTARQKNGISNNQPERRLLRGGSWVCQPKNCRCAFRNYVEPDEKFSIIGFRVVCNFVT